MSSKVETTLPSATSNSVVDLRALLAPISDDAPVGVYIRPEGFYGQIEEARSAEEKLPLGKWKRKLKSADWPRVITLATGALTTRTKDLQIAVWLAEALVKVHGFAGLRDGLALVREMHERFWEDMYPPVEDGDLDTRANRIKWLVGRLSITVKEVPLTKGMNKEAYSYFDWKSSTKPRPSDDGDDESEPDEDDDEEQGVADAPVTAEQWRAATSATSAEFYAQTLQLIGESKAELKALDRVLDGKFIEEKNGQLIKNSPALKALRDSLAEVAELVTQLSRKKRSQKPKKGAAATGKKETPVIVSGEDGREEGAAPEEIDTGAPEDLTGDGWEGDADQDGPEGQVRSREEALRRLGEVADYFRRAEPHSPVSYLVQRAIKWGRMPLEAWLEDVLGEDPVLGRLRETLGLARAAADSGDGEADNDDDDGSDADEES